MSPAHIAAFYRDRIAYWQCWLDDLGRLPEPNDDIKRMADSAADIIVKLKGAVGRAEARAAVEQQTNGKADLFQ